MYLQVLYGHRSQKTGRKAWKDDYEDCQALDFRKIEVIGVQDINNIDLGRQDILTDPRQRLGKVAAVPPCLLSRY